MDRQRQSEAGTARPSRPAYQSGHVTPAKPSRPRCMFSSLSGSRRRGLGGVFHAGGRQSSLFRLVAGQERTHHRSYMSHTARIDSPVCAPGHPTISVPLASHPFRFERTIVLDRSPGEVYEQWCDRGLWPAFARPLCRAAGGNMLKMHCIPGEVIQWYTMEGASLPTASEAWFHQFDEGRSTHLEIIVSWLGGRSHLADVAALEPGSDGSAECLSEFDRVSALLGEAVEHFKCEMERSLAA